MPPLPPPFCSTRRAAKGCPAREPLRFHSSRCARRPASARRTHAPPQSAGFHRTGSHSGPHSLQDFIGQDHILGPGKPLRRQIERDELTSIILWGPPGVGKTTLAHLIAHVTRCEFI